MNKKLLILSVVVFLTGCVTQDSNIKEGSTQIKVLPSNIIEEYEGTVDLIGDSIINNQGWSMLTSNEYGFSVLYPSFDGFPSERFMHGIGSKSGNYIFNNSPIREIDIQFLADDTLKYKEFRKNAGLGYGRYPDIKNIEDIKNNGNKGYIINYENFSLAHIFTDDYLYEITINTNEDWTGNNDKSYLGVAGKKLANQEGVRSIFFLKD